MPPGGDFASLAVLASPIRQHGSSWTLAVGGCADHATDAFRALFAGGRSGIPVLSSRTKAIRRRARGARRTRIIAGLVYDNLARSTRPLAMRRCADVVRRTIGGVAESFAERGTFRTGPFVGGACRE